MFAAPMQQIEVEPIGFQALEAALAGFDDPLPAGVPGIDLADKEDLVAATCNRLPGDLLGAAFAVHFGGVNQRHAEIEAMSEALDFDIGLAVILPHLPGAKPERWN